MWKSFLSLQLHKRPHIPDGALCNTVILALMVQAVWTLFSMANPALLFPVAGCVGAFSARLTMPSSPLSQAVQRRIQDFSQGWAPALTPTPWIGASCVAPFLDN